MGDRARRVLLISPLLLALLASVILSITMLRSEGWSVLLALAIPILITSLPAVLPAIRNYRPALAAAAVLLLVFVVLAAASIGLFYLPSAIALAVAAWRAPRADPTTAQP